MAGKLHGMCKLAFIVLIGYCTVCSRIVTRCITLSLSQAKKQNTENRSTVSKEWWTEIYGMIERSKKV
jgi:hypothetical protein